MSTISCLFVFLFVCLFVGQYVGWLWIGWLTCWLVGWQAGCVVIWFVRGMNNWFVSMNNWFVIHRVVYRYVASLVCWVVSSLSVLVDCVPFLAAWSATSVLRTNLFTTFFIKVSSVWQSKKSTSLQTGLSGLWNTSGPNTLFTTQFQPVL